MSNIYKKCKVSKKSNSNNKTRAKKIPRNRRVMSLSNNWKPKK
jgi:hypothetical protein